MGLRDLDLYLAKPCTSYPVPVSVSMSLITLELLLKVVSVPSVEAFKQLPEYQTVPGVPWMPYWAGCGRLDGGVVGSFQLETQPY